MRAACLLTILVTVLPWTASADPRPDAAVRADVIAAIRRRDVEAVKRNIEIPLEATEIRFVDPKCTSAFTGKATMIEDHELAAFVGCLADIGIATTPVLDSGVTTYGPGALLRLSVRDGKISAMTSVDNEDGTFMLVPEVFASHVRGYRPVIVPGAALKKTIDASSDARVLATVIVCVDRKGKLDAVDVQVDGDAAYEKTVRAAVKAWAIRPFTVGKVAVPACAGLHVGYPESRLAATTPPPPPPPAPPVSTPATTTLRHVAPNALERLVGDPAIVPDDATKHAMRDAGATRVIASFKLCIDVAGAVTRVETIKTSSFETYDRTLIRAMRQWKYRPYQIDGKVVPVCTAVTFVYNATPAPKPAP
ncbi:MAG TPA: hypothetical protein VFQ53_28445 [Kofleriaceae bacterium]|nr:hypothetical protein [Kofleriaceae bacterium]